MSITILYPDSSWYGDERRSTVVDVGTLVLSLVGSLDFKFVPRLLSRSGLCGKNRGYGFRRIDTLLGTQYGSGEP